MSPPTLRPCEVCGRHVQSHVGAPPCPFCAASSSSSARSFVAFVVAGASLVACQKAAPATATRDDAGATAEPAASSVAATPEPVDASIVNAEIDAGLGLGALRASGDLRFPGGGGPIRPGLLRGESAVYGPAPSDVTDSGTPRLSGVVTLGSVTVTKGSLTNHERVLAGARARLRSCYTRGLQADPSQKGTVTLVLDVAPNGEVTHAEATGPLAPEVLACMKSVGMRTGFDSTSAPAQVTAKYTCSLQQ